MSRLKVGSKFKDGKRLASEEYVQIEIELIEDNAKEYADQFDERGTGENSHLEGMNSIASGVASHAEGNNTVASGDASHAEGSWSEATGGGSHAEGGNTYAIGDYSHA